MGSKQRNLMIVQYQISIVQEYETNDGECAFFRYT